MTAKHGHAFTAHTSVDVATVASVLAQHRGPRSAATERDLAREAGLKERRFRQIASGRDGELWLLGKVNRAGNQPGGIFVCESPGQADSLDAEINTKIATQAARQKRRRDYAAAMAVAPVTQLRMLAS